MLDITHPLKIKKVNIGTEAELKYETIGYYWDDDIVNKIKNMLHEYQDLFPSKFYDMKGILGDMGFMRIPLKPDAKQVLQSLSSTFEGKKL